MNQAANSDARWLRTALTVRGRLSTRGYGTTEPEPTPVLPPDALSGRNGRASECVATSWAAMGVLPECYLARRKQPAHAGRGSMNASRSAGLHSTQTGVTRPRRESLPLVKCLAGVERRTHGSRLPVHRILPWNISVR